MTLAFVPCLSRSGQPFYTCWLWRRGLAVKASGDTALEAYQKAIDFLVAAEGV